MEVEGTNSFIYNIHNNVFISNRSLVKGRRGCKTVGGEGQVKFYPCTKGEQNNFKHC